MAEDEGQEVVEERHGDYVTDFSDGFYIFITADHIIHLIHYTYHTATHCHELAGKKISYKSFEEAAGPCD